MSMNSALNNALSGLNAVGRSAQLVSDNIANALTPGFGRRELIQTASDLGGVRVGGVRRDVDPVILSDRRLAESQAAEGRARTDFLTRLDGLYGAAGSAASLGGRIAAFESRLLEASSRPDSATRLQSAAFAAGDLAATINRIGAGLQAERQVADRGIARDVALLNTSLHEVHQLNITIAARRAEDTGALQDQRQLLIDRIAEIVPVRQIPRDRGGVALLSTGGQILLDSRPVVFGFTPVNAVTADMTLADGQLSPLSIDGRDIDIAGGTGRLDGGRLAGLFAVRDTLGPAAQAELDTFAADLIARFEDPGVDPTRAPGDPGLFTDGGAALAAVPVAGLAQRLAVNPLVDPATGGQSSRLRDGLGAGAAGPSGDATRLNALSDALSVRRPFPGGGSGSASAHGAELVARTGAGLFVAEEAFTFARTRADSLRAVELAGGVDTDQEMQKLLLIEQSYAANARVIQAIDDMMRRLLEI